MGQSERSVSPRPGRSAAQAPASTSKCVVRGANSAVYDAGTTRALVSDVQTETRPRHCCDCDKPGTEVLIIDGSPSAALALGSHRHTPSQPG